MTESMTAAEAMGEKSPDTEVKEPLAPATGSLLTSKASPGPETTSLALGFGSNSFDGDGGG